MLGCDLVCAPAHALVPDRNVLDRDPASGYPGFATHDTGRDLDVSVSCFSGHRLIVKESDPVPPGFVKRQRDTEAPLDAPAPVSPL